MPVVKLTKNTVENIPFPSQGQQLYHDEQLKGFMLRVGAKAKTYCVYSNVNRKSRQITIGRHGVYTAEEARREAREKLLMMSKGIDPAARERDLKRQEVTLNELLDEFLAARATLKADTKRQYRYYVNKYLSDWVEMPAAEITEKMFLERYLWLGENVGHATANNVRRYTGSLMNYAMAAHDLYVRNPAEMIRRTRTAFPNKRRTNILKPAQLAEWWQAVEDLESDNLRDYLRLVLLTGMRRNEAASLKWSNVDFNERSLTVDETKNGDSLCIPLGDYLFEMLKERKARAANEWVFPTASEDGFLKEPRKAVEQVRRSCGIYFTVHDLRRTFMTIAASLDISAYALKRLVNHKTSHDVTGGYIVLSIEQLRAPMQKIEDYMMGQVYGIA